MGSFSFEDSWHSFASCFLQVQSGSSFLWKIMYFKESTKIWYEDREEWQKLKVVYVKKTTWLDTIKIFIPIPIMTDWIFFFFLSFEILELVVSIERRCHLKGKSLSKKCLYVTFFLFYYFLPTTLTQKKFFYISSNNSGFWPFLYITSKNVKCDNAKLVMPGE